MATTRKTAAELAQGENEPKLPCGISKEQLLDWKKQYGESNIKHIPVYDKPGDKTHFKSVVVRKPDMDVISKASKFASEPFKAGVIIYNECVLAADPEFTTNQELKASACVSLARMFKIFESDVLDL